MNKVERPVKKQNSEQYALMTRDKFPQILTLKWTIEDLDDVIERMYYKEKGLMEKGNNFKLEDMTKKYKKVKIIMTEIT